MTPYLSAPQNLLYFSLFPPKKIKQINHLHYIIHVKWFTCSNTEIYLIIFYSADRSNSDTMMSSIASSLFTLSSFLKMSLTTYSISHTSDLSIIYVAT